MTEEVRRRHLIENIISLSKVQKFTVINYECLVYYLICTNTSYKIPRRMYEYEFKY